MFKIKTENFLSVADLCFCSYMYFGKLYFYCCHEEMRKIHTPCMEEYY